MLLIIQFPLADSRHFIQQESLPSPLQVPSWPLPAANTEFLRAFGPIRRRWRGGLSGWLGEGVICEADNAISFKGDDFHYQLKHASDDSFDPDVIPFGIAFKRFFADGLGMCKFEIGIFLDTQLVWDGISEEETVQLIKKILDLKATIPNPIGQGHISCRLHEAGKGLAQLYLWSSSHLQNFSQDNSQSWWVTACEPIMYLTQDGWGERLAFSDNETTLHIEGQKIGSLSHRFIAHHGKRLRVWNYRETAFVGKENYHRPKHYRSDSQIKARKLRLFLLRLHAEKQCLYQIIRHISRGYIHPARDTLASDQLQLYLNDSIHHIAQLRKHSVALSDEVEEWLAKELEEEMTAGEFDGLLQSLDRLNLRPNIFFKAKKELGNSVKSTLRKHLSESLSLNEINRFCFEADIDAENFPPTKNERIIELILYLERRGRLDTLTNWLNVNRADIFQ